MFCELLRKNKIIFIRVRMDENWRNLKEIKNKLSIGAKQFTNKKRDKLDELKIRKN